MGTSRCSLRATSSETSSGILGDVATLSTVCCSAAVLRHPWSATRKFRTSRGLLVELTHTTADIRAAGAARDPARGRTAE